MTDSPDAGDVLRGKRPSISRGFGLFAVAIVLLTSLTLGFTWASATVLGFAGFAGSGRLLVWFIALVAVAGAGLNAWINDGVLVSVALAAMPLIGAGGFYAVVFLVDRLPSTETLGSIPFVLAGTALAGAGVSLAVAGLNRRRDAGYEDWDAQE